MASNNNKTIVAILRQLDPTVTLIYQSCLKMGADPELVVLVIYETCLSDQSQRTNDQVLVNAVAEFSRH